MNSFVSGSNRVLTIVKGIANNELLPTERDSGAGFNVLRYIYNSSFIHRLTVDSNVISNISV